MPTKTKKFKLDPFNCKKVVYTDKEGQKCVATSSLGKHCPTCKKNKNCSGLTDYEVMTGALQSLNQNLHKLGV